MSALVNRDGSIWLTVPVVPISSRFEDAPERRTALGKTSTNERTIERIIDCGTPNAGSHWLMYPPGVRRARAPS